MKKFSIIDIARHFSISKTTVSFILNGKAKENRISEQLTNEVMAFASKHGYRPNHVAKSLRSGKTNIIALMVENIANPFFANIAKILEENAYQYGYRIIYSSTENSPAKARELLNIYHERNVDGYVLSPPVGIEKEVQMMLDKKFPIVLFDRYLPDVSTNTVVTDNFESTEKGVNHLIENGFKNIGFITIDSAQPQMIDRTNGYENAVKQHGLKSLVQKIVQPYHSKNVKLQIQRCLEQNDFDAFFFATNYLAISGLEIIKGLGIRIPDELGIVAFDDHDAFKLFSPTITVIDQPLKPIAEKVIDILMANLKNEDQLLRTQFIKIPSDLIIRESSVR